jgi:hypothetical protein
MKRILFVPLAALLAMTACSEMDPTAPEFAPAFSSGVSSGGITPATLTVNISGEGPQVCMDPRVNPDPENLIWTGFKVDPPVGGSQFGITYALSGPENEYLAWSAIPSVVVHAVLVKGGSDSYVYYYNPPALWSDAGLHSPPVGSGNTPAISHFVFCYTTTAAFEGCTPGYWKNRGITTGDWGLTGYAPDQLLNTVFTFDAAISSLGTSTMLQALDFGGGSGVLGGARNLLRAATAAILNASHEDVGYAMTAAEVLAAVNAALDKGMDTDSQWRARMLALATTLDTHNNAGCPLGAMRD